MKLNIKMTFCKKNNIKMTIAYDFIIKIKTYSLHKFNDEIFLYKKNHCKYNIC